MESTDSVSSQVEKFENFCIKKRALEGSIEEVLARRDVKAAMYVVVAKRELESTKQECKQVSARVTRARWGNFETTQGHRMQTEYVFTALPVPAQPNSSHRMRIPNDQRGVDATPALFNGPVANKQNHLVDENPPTSPESLPNRSSDAAPKKRIPLEAQASSQRATNHDQNIEDDLSDEFLTLLVQRYTDLCHERQILQEEIEDRLERKERLATEKLQCASDRHEATRQEAVEVLVALNKASGGDTRVQLLSGVTEETHQVSPFGLVPESASGSFPLNAPLSATEPTFTPPAPDNTVSKNTTATGAVGLPSCSLSNPPRSTINDQLANLIAELRHTPVAPLSPPQPPPKPPSYNVTATQQVIFKRYDELIKAAKAAGEMVPMSAVPWPLIMSHDQQYPMQNVMEKHLVNSRVTDFINLYSQWKGWNLRDDGRPMREDWEELLSVIPGYKRGGRACAAKVVSILRELVPDK